MIPVGKYNARALDHEFGQIPTTGTRYIKVNFEIIDGDHAGGSVSWNGWLGDNTIERTLDSLEHTGWDGASISNPTGIGSVDCSIDVGHEESKDGKLFARVKWVNRLGGGSKLKDEHKLDASGVSNLDREFKASLLSRKQSVRPAQPRPAQRPAPSAPPREPGEDDDLPF